MIKVEGLTKRYARTIAVDNISFEIEKGQIVGFLGPNGAGKTTTMRVLTCFLPPTAGKATVAGYDVLDKPMEVKRRIGYLPETPPLYPEMGVAEFLRFAGQLKGISGSEIGKKVKDVMGRCYLTDVQDKLIGRLSKGYRQRVGVAQAIIHNPDVLIMDEPTAGLDPKQIIAIRDLFRALAVDHTIILSTHILSEVESSCERAIIIDKGKVKANDTLVNLTSRPRDAEAIAVEVAVTEGKPDVAAVQQRLEQVPGVSRVETKDSGPTRIVCRVEALPGRQIRPDIARSIVNAGWNLIEIRAIGLSLEEVFLTLTTPEEKEALHQETEGEKK